jgi:hypothetical protein
MSRSEGQRLPLQFRKIVWHSQGKGHSRLLLFDLLHRHLPLQRTRLQYRLRLHLDVLHHRLEFRRLRQSSRSRLSRLGGRLLRLHKVVVVVLVVRAGDLGLLGLRESFGGESFAFALSGGGRAGLGLGVAFEDEL